MIGRRQLLGLLGASGLLAVPKTAAAQAPPARPFNGLTTGVGDLHRLSRAKTRSISPENFTGEKGRGGMATEGTGAQAARDLGVGWKVSPSIRIAPGATATLAEIAGAGAIQQIWVTTHYVNWRRLVLRFFWD